MAVAREAAENDDRDLWMFSADDSRRLDSLHHGHFEVHQDQVWSQLIDHAYGFLSVDGFAKHLDARILVQERRPDPT